MLLVVLEPSLGPGVVSCGIQTFLSSLQVSGKGKLKGFLFFCGFGSFLAKKKKKDTMHLFMFTHIQANIYRWNYIHYIYTGS